MRIKTISVTYHRKINLGQYNSVDLGMDAWADIGEGENAEACAVVLRTYVRENTRAEALQLIDAIRSGRKISQDDKISPELAEQYLTEWQNLEKSLDELISTIGTFHEPEAEQALVSLVEVKNGVETTIASGLPNPPATELTPEVQAKLDKAKAKMEKTLKKAKASEEQPVIEGSSAPPAGNDPFLPSP